MRKRDEIVGIVLAAGLSSRMGKFKQLLPIGDQPAVCRIAGVLKQCLEQVVVVVGHRADEVRDALVGLEVECIHNREFRDGMLSSVQCAVREVGPGRDYLFCLGDQPSLHGEIVQRVVDRALGVEAGIVIPTFNGKRGHPLFLSRSYRSEILQLGREVGLNVITRSNPHDTVEFPVACAEILDDMDTPADYAREKARAKRD
jgi:molybdenum cofactor cytidylyltransferase